MATTEVVLHAGNASRLLGRISRELSGKGGKAKECLDALGVAALRDERRRFIEHSKPGNAFWPRMGFVTAMLRPGGEKIYDAAGVEAKRSRLKRLRVTGLLLDSLSKGAAGNVFREGKLQIEVGTRDSRAALLHRGGRTRPFEFTNELRARFRKNVSRTKRGFRKPRALKSGARRKWKAVGKESPWNPFFFIWRNVFRKWERKGATHRVPARPIITAPTGEDMKRYRGIVKRFLGGVVRG